MNRSYGRRKLKSAVETILKGKEDKVTSFPGALGIVINGERVVEVNGRNGFVYVRLRNNVSEIVEAFNQNVSLVYDLPVLVTRRGNYYEIAGRDPLRYQDWGSPTSFIPLHGHTHSLSEWNPGIDPVWVYQRQFIPFLGTQTGSYGGGYVKINPGYYQTISGTVAYYQGQNLGGFLAYLPTGTQSRFILVTFNTISGTAIIRPGSYADYYITGSDRFMQYLPTYPTEEYPLIAVRLISGTSSITNNNLHDLRVFFGPRTMVTGSVGGGASALNDLTDVTITSPSDGQVLEYNSGIWSNQDVAAGSGLNAGAAVEKEVSGSAITVTSSDTRIELNNESPATLTTINGGTNGNIIILEIGNADITIDHAGGNIYINGATDWVMETRDHLMLMYSTGLNEWHEIGRGDNT